MSELAVLRLAPRVHLALAGQREAVLPARVNGHLLDEHVLDRLQQRRRRQRLGAADAEPPAGAVTRRVHLGEQHRHFWQMTTRRKKIAHGCLDSGRGRLELVGCNEKSS